MSLGLNILYEDDLLVAIDKPAGLLVHRSRIDHHETRFAMQTLRNQIGKRVYLIHRLDKPTSGVLLFALDANTARRMSEQFINREVDKQYLAIVRGYVEKSGCIRKPLHEMLDPTTDALASPEKQAQQSATEYQRLAQVELPYPVGPYSTGRYSLLKLRPLTGRRHQIRRHLNHIAHPVIGDVNHGDRHHNRFFRQHFGCHRLLLIAQSLEFSHPESNKKMRLEASMDGEFIRVMKGMGWQAFCI